MTCPDGCERIETAILRNSWKGESAMPSAEAVGAARPPLSAEQLSLYPAGYLSGSPSVERVLETVERLEEDLTDVATVHRPITATVNVGEPIEVTPTDRDLGALMNEVRGRILKMLGNPAESAVDAEAPARRDDERQPFFSDAARRRGPVDRGPRRGRGGRSRSVVLDPIVDGARPNPTTCVGDQLHELTAGGINGSRAFPIAPICSSS